MLTQVFIGCGEAKGKLGEDLWVVYEGHLCKCAVLDLFLCRVHTCLLYPSPSLLWASALQQITMAMLVIPS